MHVERFVGSYMAHLSTADLPAIFHTLQMKIAVYRQYIQKYPISTRTSFCIKQSPPVFSALKKAQVDV